MTQRTLLFASAFLFIAAVWAQDQSSPHVREYPFPEVALRAALQNIGAYTGSRLPSLDGFISGEAVNTAQYQRPYYEYKIDLVPASSGQTQVRVAAKVSAWYAAPNGEGSYRTLESNGRLENDLLDRLSDYLQNKSADPAVLKVRVQQAQADTEEAKQRLKQLESQLQHLKNNPTTPQKKEFASVIRPQTTVRSAPADTSKVLLKAQTDDQFEVLEHRGAWLRVALENSHEGWVQVSQVKWNEAIEAAGAPAPSNVKEFTIIREMSSEFSGDWTQLKGKRALYIWARPQGSGLNLTGNKLQFAKSVFLQRYKEISHASQNPVAGVVVIFLDQQGGVAAASMAEIRLFSDGSLSQDAFLKKCSFDPPSAFIAAHNSD
jgi:hypothetical protein